jgi:uncharacterized protein (TIRG00374 family)
MRNVKKIVSLAISVILGTALFTFITSHIGIGEIINSFKSFSFIKFLFYFSVSLTIVVVVVLRWSIILRSQGYKISFFKLMLYRMAGYAVSYLTPSAHVGGEFARAYLLKREGVPFSRGFTSIIIDKSLEITSDIFFASVGAIIILLTFNVSLQLKVLLTVVLSLLILLVVTFYHRMYYGKGFFTTIFRILKLHKIRFLMKYEKILEEVELHTKRFFNHNIRTLVSASIISCFLWVLMIIEYKLAILLLGYNAPLAVVFLSLSMVGLAYIIPIPAALGVLEAGQFSIFTILGIQASIGVALGFLVRIRDLIWTFAGIIILSYYGLNFLIAMKDNLKKT